MRKSISVILSVIFMTLSFCVCSLCVSGIADGEGDVNLLYGVFYTTETTAGATTPQNPDSGTMMTDGAFRGDGSHAFDGNSAVNGVTVEWFGRGKTITYSFYFDGETDITTVVFKNVRVAQNAAFGSLSVNGGDAVPFDSLNKTPVADAPLFGDTEEDQYYDISVDVNLASVTELVVALTTDAYKCQFDEIEAYDRGVDVPAESSEESSENSEESYVSESSDQEESSEVDDLLIGDTNGDGDINSLDAAQVLKHDAVLISLENAALQRADVNGDGSANSLDAAQILKYDAGMIIGF